MKCIDVNQFTINGFKFGVCSLKMAFHAETCRNEVKITSCIVSTFSWCIKWKYWFKMWAGQLSRYSDWLWTARSWDRIVVGRDFPPVQTGPGAHPASCTMGTGSFPGVKYGRGVMLTTHTLLVPRSWKSRAIPLPTLWATTGPVTGTYLLHIQSVCLKH